MERTHDDEPPLTQMQSLFLRAEQLRRLHIGLLFASPHRRHDWQHVAWRLAHEWGQLSDAMQRQVGSYTVSDWQAVIRQYREDDLQTLSLEQMLRFTLPARLQEK